MNDAFFQPGLYVSFGLLAGAAVGWLFQRIWRRILPRPLSRAFWQGLPVNLRGMMKSAEPDDMLRHYQALLRATAGFAGRNLLGISLGIAPIAILLLAYDGLNLPGRFATQVEAYPASTISRMAMPSGEWRVDGQRLLVDRRSLSDVPLRVAGHALDRSALAGKQAFCETTLSCLSYDILLFETHRIDSVPDRARSGSIVMRPRLLDRNSLWPYLDDVEFWFFIAVMAGSAAAAWRSRQGRASSK
ncbi:MAG: hypothetical protein ACREVI_04375 [Steroidobacteraceae bacterium]